MIPQIDNSIDDTNLVNEVILPSRTYKLSSNYETQIKYGETQNAVGEIISLSDAAEVKLKKLDIFGNLKQNGTPSPETPVDADVFSGNNIIYIHNNNLFKPSLEIDNTSIYVNDATVSLIGDEFTFEATGSDMYFGQVASAGANYSKMDGEKIYRKENTHLSILLTNTNFNRIHITAYNSRGVSLGYTGITGSSTTYAFPQNCDFVSIRVGKNNAVSGTIYKTKVMVVYGNEIPNNYNIYEEQKFNLDLPTENLFDGQLELGTLVNGTGEPASSTRAMRTVNFIKVNPNTTYTLSNDKNYTPYVFEYDSSETYIRNSTTQITPYTFTTGANTRYVKFRTLEGKTENDLSVKFMFEKGYKANNYNSYGASIIELCKVENYKDYFYEDSNKWYLHKQIGKFFSDKQSDWTNDSNGRYFKNITNIIVPPNNITVGTGKCNVGLVTANQTIPGDAFKAGVAIHPISRIYISADVYNNIDIIPIVLYYVYINPIDIEIVDINLINQLNNLKEAKTYQNITNIFSMNEVGPILDIDYYPLSSIYYETVQVDRISGFIDDKDAIRQAVYHILSIERYSCLIYDDNYGVELQQYIGQDFEYLRVTIQKTLEEALMQDERIISIDVMDIEKIDNETANVKLSIQANVGEIQMEVNVNV